MLVRSARALGGGMNSATALIDLGGARAVLKWVPVSGAAQLTAGCDVAHLLAHHGIHTGSPIATIDGALIQPFGAGVAALLRFVPGDPLNPKDEQDQRDMARILAMVHSVDVTVRSGAFMADEITAMVREVEPWIRPTVHLVLDEYRGMPDLTWGVLHGDPESGAFLREPETGQVGLIDWGAASRGPVLYDVASVLMYLGGRTNATAFWETYLDLSPASSAELLAHIDTFTRYRAAVQAAYFSMRIGSQDRTGISGDQENWKGLRDAERMLETAGAVLVRP